MRNKILASLTIIFSLTCSVADARAPKPDFLTKVHLQCPEYLNTCTLGLTDKDPLWTRIPNDAYSVKDLESQVNSVLETYPINFRSWDVICVTVTPEGNFEKPFLMHGDDYRLAKQIARSCVYRSNSGCNFRHAVIEIWENKFAGFTYNANHMKEEDAYFDNLRSRVTAKNPLFYAAQLKR